MKDYVIAVYNDSGECVVTYGYDTWGMEMWYDAVSGYEDIAEVNRIRYRSYYFDSETYLYYMQSRYYDPYTGRFINADDTDYLGVSDTVFAYNAFAYCENNPVNNVDEDGKYTVSISDVVEYTSVGFDVYVKREFLDKTYCLKYAKKIINKKAKGKKTYKNMTKKRIAQELYAHAWGYVIGKKLKLDSSVKGSININGVMTSGINSAYKIMKKINSKVTNWLISHSELINVNNNEKTSRVIVFKTIWKLVPEQKIKETYV